MKVKSVVYAGIKTDKFDELCKFYEEDLGLAKEHYESDFAVYVMPSGDKVEIYGPNDPNKPNHDSFITGPVVGFDVDDIGAARESLEAKGTEFLGPIYSAGSSKWSHFRGPDGNVYELTQRIL